MISTLLLSLIPALSEIPSAIRGILLILILVAITLYLRELFEKIKVEQAESTIITYMLPVIISITTIMIMGILLTTTSSPTDVPLVDWLYKVINIEAAILYLIQLYEKI